jgi:hypothetical protein
MPPHPPFLIERLSVWTPHKIELLNHKIYKSINNKTILIIRQK